MSARHISRRQFLHVSTLTAAGLVVAACGATPTATPVPPTATKPPVAPTATTAPAAPAAPTATKAPAAPTAAPAAPTAAPVAKYKEAPMLAQLVSGGKLPTVDKRLPDEPWVVTPTSEVGKYGGSIRSFMLNDADVWAPGNAGLFYALINIPRDVAAFGKGFPQVGYIPTLCKAYKWNNDATELTVTLRKGMKWSDGQPYTADDIMWVVQDIYSDTNLNKTIPSWLTAGGKPATVTSPDANTVVFKFAAANPFFVQSLYSARDLTALPKHFLSQSHPKHNAKATYDDFNKVKNQILNPALPMVTAWTTESSTPEAVTLVRNPYFCAVDTAGNQLPYADRWAFPMVGTTDNAILKSIAGEIDFAERNMQQIDQLPMLRENQTKGNYKILYWNGAFFGTGNTMGFNYILADSAYPELREMLRTRDFRYALNIAIDRKDMNDTIYLGTGRPAMWALNSSSPYWDDEMAEIVAPVFDVAKAKTMLDALDLKDRNGDGIREYPNGKNVTIFIEVSSELKPHQMSGEMVVRYWKAIGLDARLSTLARTAVSTNRTKHTHHVSVWGPFNADIPQMTTEEVIAPSNMANMIIAAQAGEKLPDDLMQLEALRQKITASISYDEQKKLLKELAQLRVDRAIDIHTVADLPYLVVCSNRMGNVPAKGSALRAIFVENQHQWYIKS